MRAPLFAKIFPFQHANLDTVSGHLDKSTNAYIPCNIEMALLCLSRELLLLVAGHLERQKDINSFARTCVDLRNVRDAYFYNSNVKIGNDSALWWAVRRDKKQQLENQ